MIELFTAGTPNGWKASITLEELGGASDAGERILDLRRERRAKHRNRARAAAVAELMVETVGHRAGVEHHQHVPWAFSER